MLDETPRRRCCMLTGSGGLGLIVLGGEQHHLAEAFGQPVFRVDPGRIVEEDDSWATSAAPAVSLVVENPGTNAYRDITNRSLSPVSAIRGAFYRSLSPVFSFALDGFSGGFPAREQVRSRPSPGRYN